MAGKIRLQDCDYCGSPGIWVNSDYNNVVLCQSCRDKGMGSYPDKGWKRLRTPNTCDFCKRDARWWLSLQFTGNFASYCDTHLIEKALALRRVRKGAST